MIGQRLHLFCGAVQLNYIILTPFSVYFSTPFISMRAGWMTDTHLCRLPQSEQTVWEAVTSWLDLPPTLGTTAASHQQLRHAHIQELQQETAGGDTHTAVVGEHPVQRHWEENTSVVTNSSACAVTFTSAYGKNIYSPQNKSQNHCMHFQKTCKK